jgi:hypothetical protein
MRAFFILLAAVGVLCGQHLDTSAWTAMGPGGTVRATRDALAFTYELGAKGISAAVLPVPGGLAGMERIRFRIKADHNTAVVLSLSEKKPGGGDYSAVFWAPANTWQQVDLAVDDFSANDGPNDPVDSNGKLNLDQVVGLGIVDLAYFFTLVAQNENFPLAVDRSSGTHTLQVDGLQILTSSPSEQHGAEKALVIDHFDHGCLQWITLGGMTLKWTSQESPLGMASLQASYEQNAGPYAFLVRRLASLDLSKATRLVFDIASEREATLLVSLEIKKPGSSQGPRYNLTIFPPGARKVFHVNLSLADFELDANTRIPGPGRLDPARLKSIAITDITVASGGDGGANTIWIGKVEAK